MPSKYVVAVIGGAVSGAEAVHQLTQRDIRCVVFDQNKLPYGKIEDGLPKWHSKLRDKEENNINQKLSHPLVDFVPEVRLGRDVTLGDLVEEWGFSAILLAIGAWRDRPLPVDGIDEFLGKGLIYQNPFIYWFNHKHEPGFDSGAYQIKDDAIVIGGGLASLDVVKVLMIELVQKALRERGHDFNMFQLDRSIAKVLDSLDLTFDDLGIEGCKLYYRRRIKDMPLSPFQPTTPEEVIKAENVREKVLNNYASKYLFKIAPLHVPVDKIVEDGKLKGLVFQETRIEGGRAVAIPDSEKEVRGSYIISSIGSIPEPISGIPQRGSVYDVYQDDLCRIAGYRNVFALGNTVTGRGNIKESMRHGREIAQQIIDSHMDDAGAAAFEASVETQRASVAASLDGIVANIDGVSDAVLAGIDELVDQLQAERGYPGDFMQWADAHKPVRLEDLVGGH